MRALLSKGPGGPSLSRFPCGLNDMSVKAFSIPQTKNDITDTSICAVAAAQFRFLASGCLFGGFVLPGKANSCRWSTCYRPDTWIQQSGLIRGGTFQDPEWMPESTDGAKLYVYYVFAWHSVRLLWSLWVWARRSIVCLWTVVTASNWDHGKLNCGSGASWMYNSSTRWRLLLFLVDRGWS